MATIKEAIARIEAHERECEIRYKNIEEKLKEGSDKFKRLEMMLWGIYPFIVGVFLFFGFVGSVIPVIPGPPISFFAIVILHFFSPWNEKMRQPRELRKVQLPELLTR